MKTSGRWRLTRYGWELELAPAECSLAAEIAGRRGDMAREQHWTPRFLPEGRTQLAQDYLGAKAELAVAIAEHKPINTAATDSIERARGPDVGDWEVKATDGRPELRLNAAQAQLPGAREKRYLAVMVNGARITLLGWLPGEQLIRDENLRALRYSDAYCSANLRPYELPSEGT